MLFNVLVQLVQLRLQLLLTLGRVFELHRRQPIHQISGHFANLGPGIVGRGRFNSLHRGCMEGADVAQHPDSLVEGTVAIVGGEAVLLQKVVPDETSNVEGDLVTLSQCALSHQLDNLGQILLGLQNLLAFRPQGGEIAAAFQALVERLQRLQVLGVAEGPVDGGKVFPLRQFLVQAPENLDNPKSR